MPKSTTFANDFLLLILNAVSIADFAEDDTTAPATDLYLSLHTADPGVGGSQLTNETAYTNYVRIAVPRDATGWTIAAAVAENFALAQFAQCGVTGATITHVAVGTAAAGAGKVMWAGALSSSLAVANGIQPQFAATALTITEA
jgi:hypothetical protein